MGTIPEPLLISTRRLIRVVVDETLVDTISIEVRAPERCVVFGPSGSGKTPVLYSLKPLG